MSKFKTLKKALLTHQKCIILLGNKKVNESWLGRFFRRRKLSGYVIDNDGNNND